MGSALGLPAAALSLMALAGPEASAGHQDAEAGSRAPEPRPVWRSVPVRHAGFDVDVPRWRPLGTRLSVLRRSDGLARELFQFGAGQDGRRHAAIAVDRGDIRAAAAEDDIRALAAEAGLAARLAASPLALRTKFGALPAADMVVDGPDGPQACLAFSMRSAAAGLRITGWVCNAGSEIVSRAEASCFVDRLFAVAVRKPAIAALFAEAELRRRACPRAPAAGRAERTAAPALRMRRL